MEQLLSYAAWFGGLFALLGAAAWIMRGTTPPGEDAPPIEASELYVLRALDENRLAQLAGKLALNPDPKAYESMHHSLGRLDARGLISRDASMFGSGAWRITPEGARVLVANRHVCVKLRPRANLSA